MVKLASIFEVDSSPRRVVPMEGLRGYAVLLVFFVHYFTLIEPWIATDSGSWALASVIRDVGHSGVDLFFVLSGYLIYGTLIAKVRPLGPYFVRRVERIYPTFLCMFVIYVALSFAMPSESKIPSDFVPATLYLFANALLLPGLAPIEPVITVAWSLSYEIFYYLTIPLVIGVLALRRWSPAQRVALWIVVGALIFTYAWFYAGHVRLAMFVSGILLYETLRPIKARVADAAGFAGLVLAIALIVLVSALELHPPLRFIALFVAFYALCYGAFAARGACARAFSWTPLRWLGNMSYSYYLCHGLTLKAFFLALSFVFVPRGDQAMSMWLLLPIALGATLVVSAVLFILVEKPYSLTPRPRPAPQPQNSQIPARPSGSPSGVPP